MRRVASLVAVFALASCDSFFTVRGRITRCTDDHPLVGVRLELVLVDGVSSQESVTAYSDPDGSFEAALNEPPGVSVRLVADKPGYASEERSYAGAPSAPDDFCLAPLDRLGDTPVVRVPY